MSQEPRQLHLGLLLSPHVDQEGVLSGPATFKAAVFHVGP